jgi:hypothetical protein
LAVSALPFFEPAKLIALGELFVTLGEIFVTLGQLFVTLGESFSLFFRLSSMLCWVANTFNARSNLYHAGSKNDELSLVLKLNRLARILKHGAPPTAKVTLGRLSLDLVNRQIYIGYLHT